MVMNYLKLIKSEQAEVLLTPIRTYKKKLQFGLMNYAAETI